MKKDELVEYIEYINKKGVITKRTLGGVELPILTDLPSYKIMEEHRGMDWGKITRYLTQEEAKVLNK